MPMSDLNDVTAVVLCGGQGTRLKSVVPDRPKALADINGTPFIFLLLEQLQNAGLTRAILCTGYLAKSIRESIGERYKNLDICYSQELSPLGTGGALVKSSRYLDTSLALVMNGDSYVNLDIVSVVEWHNRMGASITVVVKKMEDVRRYGRILMSDSYEIIEFNEKDTNLVDTSGWINVGVYLMNKKAIDSIPKRCPLSLEVDCLPSVLRQGVFGYATSGEFIDIGTPESLTAAKDFFPIT